MADKDTVQVLGAGGSGTNLAAWLLEHNCGVRVPQMLADSGWKHGAYVAPQRGYEVPAVFVVRHPFDWLLAQYRGEVRKKRAKSGQFRRWLLQPRRDNHESWYIAQWTFRSSYYYSRIWPARTVLVRFRDLVLRPKEIVETVALALDLPEPTGPFRAPTEIVSPHRPYGPDAVRERVKRESWRKAYTPEMVDYLNARIDKTTMADCGYEWPIEAGGSRNVT